MLPAMPPSMGLMGGQTTDQTEVDVIIMAAVVLDVEADGSHG